MIAALMAAAAMGGGDAPAVAIPGRFYAPQRVSVLAGQTVTWRNDDSVDHTVTSSDAGFDSGRVGHGATFSFAFETPGVYEYNCTIHRYMRGTIEVSTLALGVPAKVPTVGGEAMLDGLAPAGTGEVTLERKLADGSFEAVGTATPDPAGHFSFTVTADAPARYRARSGELASSEARLDVAPRLTLTARRAGRRIRAQVNVSPAQSRGRVVLERFVLERYGWVRLRAATLTGASTASFTVGPSRRISLRARLAKPVGGYAPGVSAVARVRR